jgi:hypothetical protein
MRGHPAALVGIALFFLSPGVSAQGLALPAPILAAEKGPQMDSPLAALEILRDLDRLREFVRAEEFALIRSHYGDLVAVDKLFAAALELTGNNRHEALLIALFATMNHKDFRIRLAPLRARVWVPLSTEFDDEFQDRLAKLPRHLYLDSPGTRSGDVDKLQHFFGSALLAFALGSPDLAERIGDVVELGEEHFVVDGRFDERDRRANGHGRAFGLSLLTDLSAVPSNFFTVRSLNMGQGRLPPSSSVTGKREAGMDRGHRKPLGRPKTPRQRPRLMTGLNLRENGAWLVPSPEDLHDPLPVLRDTLPR